MLTRKNAISLLKKHGCDEKLIAHCTAVSKLAVEIAKGINKRGHDVDIKFIEIAALLHDIGRTKNHGIMHGIEGAKILREHPKIARVCEVHIGAGINKKEATVLGLPPRDFLPETLEEKIIAHADNLIDGSEVVDIEKTMEKMGKRLGKQHSAIRRMKVLDDYIEGLMNG